jgi:hypothetical protein
VIAVPLKSRTWVVCCAPERKAADGFYIKLSPEQQQAYSQRADAEFSLMWGNEPPNAKAAGQIKWVLRAQQLEKDYPGQVALL